MSTINTKIQLRTDTEANWSQKKPVLKLGEIAIVLFDNGYKDLKIGDGATSFDQLPYLYQNEITTDKITGKDLNVKSIAQGYNVTATPTSLATGIFSKAEGNFDVVHGIEAKAAKGHDYAFVFNGTNLPGIGTTYYESHGEGTFNVNPLNGLSGFYIGEQSLSSILSAYFLSNEISNYYDITQINQLNAGLYARINEVSDSLDAKVASNTAVIAAETAARSAADEKLSSEISSLSDSLSSYGKTIDYDSTVKKIYLKNGSSVLASVDCTDFIKDGMLSTAYLSGRTLVLVFNTDAGKTPVSVDLSSFVDNYDSQISALSNAISTIGEDYLDSNDKLELYNDLLSPDEVKLYRGPGTKDVSLSVGTGTQLCVYTASLSDFAMLSDISGTAVLSDYEMLSNKISSISSYPEEYQYPTARIVWEISDYIDGFEKAVYGEDKDRNLDEEIVIPEIDPEIVTSPALLNAQINGILVQYDSQISVRDEDDFSVTVSAVDEIYDQVGETEHYEMNNPYDVISAINNIANTTPNSTFSFSPYMSNQIMFGGSAGTNKTVKAQLLENRSNIRKLRKDVNELSANLPSGSSKVKIRTWTD